MANGHYMATKITWCMQNYRRVQKAYQNRRLKILPLSTFLSSCLSLCRSWGNLIEKVSVPAMAKSYQVDRSIASRSLVYNISTGQWDDELLALFLEYLDKNVSCSVFVV